MLIMKFLKYPIICFISFTSVSAQIIPASEDLDINNVRATIHSSSTMFSNISTNKAAYEFPKGSQKNLCYNAGLWMNGYDASGVLLAAASLYRNPVSKDFWPGPLNALNLSDTLIAKDWNRLWKVNRSEINTHIANSVHTTLNTPQVILEWPAFGNINARGSNNVSLIISKEMAPYIDFNNDGIYNALDGDYPDILGDQAIWWVYNDMANPKTLTASAGMHIEVRAMAYGCNTSDDNNNTTFYSFKIYNGSNTNYTDYKIGSFLDADIGNNYDDYIGYDSSRNLAISYNADSIDEGTNGYGTDIPQVGIQILNISAKDSTNATQPIAVKKFMYFASNGGLITSDPQNKMEFNNFLNGKWRNGVNLQSSCDGYSAGNPINYAFPDDPSIIGGLSEKECLSLPGDKRMLISSAPFTFYKNTFVQLDYAILAKESAGIANFSAIKTMADFVKNTYITGGCNTSFPAGAKDLIKNTGIKLYPNPFGDVLNILLEDKHERIQQVILYDAFGNRFVQNSSNVIQIKNLVAGLYYCKVITNKNTYAQQVLKQ
jgi:hypothetical protein